MAVRKVMRDVEQHLEEQLDQEAIELGLKIRALRKSALLSARQLAEQIGVSRSLIAQIERGAASPSLTTLRRIADRLGVPVAALFLDSDEAASGDCDRTGRQLVVRADQRRRLHTRHTNVTYTLLTPDVNRKIEFILAEIDPGATVPAEPNIFAAHQGEENVLCLEGQAVFIIGGEEFQLGPGDSISFDCSVPHRLENRADKRVVMVCAVTPPTF
jgi:transcriptional regulator with XRE-family HTH domain